MNMIAATLLYHCSDFMAFWLMVFLLNKLKLRYFFEPKMPGFQTHTDILEKSVAEKLPDLFEHFQM